MRAALQDVAARLGRSHPLGAGGKRVETDGEIVSLDLKAGGPDYLPLHTLARTVVERL